MRVAGLSGLVVGCTLLAGAADVPASGDASTNFLKVAMPAGEKSFLMAPAYPASRIWRFQNTNDVEIHTTCRGVGPDSALVVFTARGEKPGEVLAYDIGAHGDDLKNYKGVSFWMRGDGGDGDLIMGVNWNQEAPANPRLGKFPLAQKEWKKFFVPWDQFTPGVAGHGFYFLNLKVAPGKARAAWAVVSRINLYQTETCEPIQPPVTADPPGMIPAASFVQPGVAEAARLIPRTLARLKARQPVTIVSVGDSITAGAQLWYRNDSKHAHTSEESIYFAVLAQRLAQHYGYASHRSVLKMWQAVDKQTGKTPAGATNDSFAVVSDVQPAPDGALPFDGLQVIGVGAGGKESQFGLAHLADATMYKPDLVIWFYGANDMPGNRRKEYKTYSAQAIQALQQQGIEVILARPTVFASEYFFDNCVGFLTPARELAAENKVPLVDQFGAFNARGRRYLGDLLSDTVHPNEYGHQILAATLAAALGVPDQVVWAQDYFRAQAAGGVMP